MGTFASTLGQRGSKARSGRGVGQQATESAAARLLHSLGTVSFWIIIFVVPLMMAVIRETGVAVFVGCSLTMSVAWSVGQLWAPQTGSPFSVVVLLAAAALLLVGLQLVPLPRTIIELLSPFSGKFLPAWNAGLQSLPQQQHYWSRISMTPSLTRSGFVCLIAYVAFFLTLLQRIKTISDVDSILRLLSIATVVMAVIGLGQLFFGNGDYLWMLKHPFRDASWPAKGTFTNQNHFAHYLALGIGPLVWSWKTAGAVDGHNIKGKVSNRGFGVARSSDSNQQLIGGAIAIVVFAAVLSFSRGGIVSIAIACVCAMAALGRQSAGILRLALPTVGFMAVGVLLFGTDMLETKWQALTEAESMEDLCRGRSWLWGALLTAFPSFWPAGSGVGSHAEVYPTWMEQDIGKRLSHAESGYFQVMIETGLPGLMILFAAIGLCVYWVLNNWTAQDPENRFRRMILATGLSVSLLHSIVDFVWYIPACLIFALILAACLCRTHQLGEQNQGQAKRTTHVTWPVCWAMMIALFALPVGRLSADVAFRDAGSESAWESYREQAVTVGNRRNFASLDELDERLELMIMHLEECHRIAPADCRALSELSALYVHRFEKNQQTTDNPMSLQEIRGTVESTEFESPKEILKWLRRAFGGNAADLYRAYAAAERAVQGQPLRGECYLVLAQLSFLRGSSAEERDALIDQAVLVRPYEARILYFAGMAEVEKGNLEKACEWWKKAFHVSEKIKPLIVHTLAAHYTPQEIIQRIEPDPDGLWILFREYEAKGATQEKDWLIDHYARNFELFLPAIEETNKVFWLHSTDILKASGMNDKAVFCMGQAIKQNPQDYQLRKKFGLLLMTVDDNDAAAAEFEWCLLRNPDDQEVTKLLASIKTRPLHGGAL